MKKFNGFEAHLLEHGLKMYVEAMVNDTIEMERQDKRPIMTVNYIRAIELQVLVKLKSLTLKQR